MTEKIGACVDNIDTYLAELARLNVEYKAKANAGKSNEPEFTLSPEEVMANFEQACKEAEVANAEAVELANEAEKMAEELKTN